MCLGYFGVVTLSWNNKTDLKKKTGLITLHTAQFCQAAV